MVKKYYILVLLTLTTISINAMQQRSSIPSGFVQMVECKFCGVSLTIDRAKLHDCIWAEKARNRARKKAAKIARKKAASPAEKAKRRKARAAARPKKSPDEIAARKKARAERIAVLTAKRNARKKK